MTESVEHKNIHAAIIAISREAGAIGKDSKNTMQGFMFRGIDAVMNAMHPLFAKHGVFILPEVLDEKTEERVTAKGSHLIYRILRIKYTFAHTSGTSVYSVHEGEGMDSGDKAANKASAVSLKYALTQLLLLPYDEVDPDGDTPPPSAKKPATKPAAKKQTPPASDPDLDAAGLGGDNMPPAPKASATAIKDWYNLAMKKLGDADMAKEFMETTTGKSKSADLNIDDIRLLTEALHDAV